MTTTKRFSQLELEQAYAQMKEERAAEVERAASARTYLLQQLSLPEYGITFSAIHPPPAPTPHSVEYYLEALFRPASVELGTLFESDRVLPTYQDLEAMLSALPDASRLPSEGFGTTVFEVGTPGGKYKVKLVDCQD